MVFRELLLEAKHLWCLLFGGLAPPPYVAGCMDSRNSTSKIQNYGINRVLTKCVCFLALPAPDWLFDKQALQSKFLVNVKGWYWQTL